MYKPPEETPQEANNYKILFEWARKDLNLRPADYESDALTN